VIFVSGKQEVTIGQAKFKWNGDRARNKSGAEYAQLQIQKLEETFYRMKTYLEESCVCSAHKGGGPCAACVAIEGDEAFIPNRAPGRDGGET
jgi:hypothetical protein